MEDAINPVSRHELIAAVDLALWAYIDARDIDATALPPQSDPRMLELHADPLATTELRHQEVFGLLVLPPPADGPEPLAYDPDHGSR